MELVLHGNFNNQSFIVILKRKAEILFEILDCIKVCWN